MTTPPGSANVTPYFFVDGAGGFVDFLVQGLGGVRDAWSNLWWISQRLVTGTYAA